MNNLVYTCVVIVSIAQSSFSQTNQFIDSATADNLFVRIYFQGGKSNLDAESKIIFGILEKTNETVAPIIYFPKTAYFCEMQLIESNGAALSKSYIGEKYGKQFSELRNYSWDTVNKRGQNTGGSDKPDMAIVHTNRTSGPDFPSVQELFKIEKIGEYKLSLQFQVFKMIRSEKNYYFKIVQIPKVEIPICKTTE